MALAAVKPLRHDDVTLGFTSSVGIVPWNPS